MSKEQPRTAVKAETGQKGDNPVPLSHVSDVAENKPDKAADQKDATSPAQQNNGENKYSGKRYAPRDPGLAVYFARKWLQDNSNLITAVASVLALVVIVWQGIIYVRQTDLMEKTWIEMKETREVENRSWVGVKPAFYAVYPEEGLVTIQIAFTNTGNVPATATGIINGQCLAQAPTNDAAYSQPTTLPSQMTLMPGAEFPHTVVKLKAFPYCGKEPPPSMKTQGVIVENLQSAPAYFYVYGTIKYEDLFGSHETQFCFFSLPSVREQQPVFTACPTHNTFK